MRELQSLLQRIDIYNKKVKIRQELDSEFSLREVIKKLNILPRDGANYTPSYDELLLAIIEKKDPEVYLIELIKTNLDREIKKSLELISPELKKLKELQKLIESDEVKQLKDLNL